MTAPAANSTALFAGLPRPLLYAAVIVAAIIAVYGCSLAAPFELDDFRNIHENPTIRRLVLDPDIENVYARRPVGRWSLWLNYQTSGLDPASYRALNIAVHCLAALTLFGLVRRTLKLPQLAARFGRPADELALAIALLWALHPLQTQSVTYIIQRLESLMGLFFLLMLYGLVRGQTARWAWPWNIAAIAACLLSIGSKEVGAVAPLIALLLDRILLADSWRELARRRWWLYAGCLAGWFWMAGIMASPADANRDISGQLSRWEYLRSQPGVILHYLRLTAWPDELVLDYDWPVTNDGWAIAIPGAMLTVLLVAGLIALRKRSTVGLLIGSFFIILAPTSSFVPIADLCFEHRMYLPLVPVVMLAVFSGHWLAVRYIADLRARQWAATGAVLLVAATLGARTYARNQDWNDPVRLWSKNVAACPLNPRAWANLAKVQLEANLSTDAVASARRGCELQPNEPWQHYILGLALAATDQHDAAESQYRAALAHKPRFRAALLALAQHCHAEQRTDEARRDYELVLALDPQSAAAHDGLARLLAADGDPDAAKTHFQQAVACNPHESQFRVNYGAFLARRGEFAEAIDQYDQAVRLSPQFATAWLQRALAQFESGDDHGARDSVRIVLRLRPNSQAARELLARMEQRLPRG